MAKPKAELPGISARAATKAATLNKATIRRFLDHLAATCHVQGAAGAAGASTSSFYKRRRSDPAFAEAWRVAIQAGYDRLEEALLARAIEEVNRYEVDAGAVTLELIDAGDDDTPPLVADVAAGSAESDSVRKPPRRRGRGGLHTSAGFTEQVARIDVQLALTLLNRRAAIETRGRERHVRKRPSAEEVEKALTTKLDTLSRRLAAPIQ